MARTSEQLRLQKIEFRALGTDILVYSPVASDRTAAIAGLVEEYEARFSRFRPDSEVSRLSAAAGRAVPVSYDLFDILGDCARFWRETGGVFDPLILASLEAEGYDRTFEEVPLVQDESSRPQAPVHTFDEVVLDRVHLTARLPAGSRLDLGGIGKGWIADRLAESLAVFGPFLVDLGGDIRAGGPAADGGPWLVAVADPLRPDEDVAWVNLRDDAIATSTTARRRWVRGSVARHHLIDPRTGRSSETDVVQVSVVAPTAAEADVCAKTALLMGRDAGVCWLSQRRLPALVVPDRGDPIRVGDWEQYEQPMDREGGSR